MNNEELQWCVVIYGGMFLAGLAISTFILALICTGACIVGKFSVRPIALYWCSSGWLGVMTTMTDWVVPGWIFLFISPVFIALFWYYDRQTAKQMTTSQESAENDNN